MERGVGLILDTSSFISSVLNPRVHDEMDFFSNEKMKKISSSSADSDVKVPNLSHNDHQLDVNTGLHLLTASVGSERSAADDGGSSNEDDRESRNELSVLQSELSKLKEENQRLKSMLSQVTNNYNSLHMQFITFMQQKNHRSPQMQEVIDEKMDIKKQSLIPRQFMDLGLASAAADNDEVSSMEINGASRETSISPSNEGSFRKEMVTFDPAKAKINREGSPEQSSQGWIPNKSPKVLSTSNNSDQAQEATMRKARVSVRARSEAPMITDGCQWRKYGQKMAKGNPCPRAYYRCTMAAGCPVRKQVQRCAEDRTILITTYEGNHNHLLPPAAVAMASTTSAAATMLLSGSMSTTDTIMNHPNNFLAKSMLPPCSSTLATISASAPFPTITLDLTQTPNLLQPQPPASAAAGQFQLALPANSTRQIFGQSIGGQSSKLSAADTVSAATAAITADPNFTAALAAAIKSIIGGGGSGGGGVRDHNTNSNGNGSTRESCRNDTSS